MRRSARRRHNEAQPGRTWTDDSAKPPGRRRAPSHTLALQWGRESSGRMLAATAAVGCALIAIGVSLAAPVPHTAPPPPSGKSRHALDDRLRQFVDRSRRPGAASTAVDARASGLAATAGRLRVVVSGPGAAQAVTAAEGRSRHRPPASCRHSSSRPTCRRLPQTRRRRERRATRIVREAAVTGEGLATTGAAQFGTAGTGAGTTVAVIDLTFAGCQRPRRGRAASRGHSPSTIAVATSTQASGHGTAVAEIVHDVAPGAQLLLICVNSEVTLAQAVDDAIAQGATIINHSVQWFNIGRGDGTGRRVTRRERRKRRSQRDRLGQRRGERSPNALGRHVRRYERQRPERIRSRRRRERHDRCRHGTNVRTPQVGRVADVVVRLRPLSRADVGRQRPRVVDRARRRTTPSPPAETLCWTNTSGRRMCPSTP